LQRRRDLPGARLGLPIERAHGIAGVAVGERAGRRSW